MSGPLSRIPAIALKAARAAGAVRDVTLKKTAQGSYSTATLASTGTSTDYAAKAVLWEYELREIDGSVIRRGDKRYIVFADGLSVSPAPRDRLTDGSETYEVIAVDTVPAGDNTAIYIAQARK